MHGLDLPIVLTRPPNYTDRPFELGEEDIELECAAKAIFAMIGVGSIQFEEPAVPNQDYVCLWSGSKDGIKYEVQRGQGPHADEYPIWIWVELENEKGWSDRLPEEAHELAAKLSGNGYLCKVKGFISAMGQASL